MNLTTTFSSFIVRVTTINMVDRLRERASLHFYSNHFRLIRPIHQYFKLPNPSRPFTLGINGLANHHNGFIVLGRRSEHKSCSSLRQLYFFFKELLRQGERYTNETNQNRPPQILIQRYEEFFNFPNLFLWSTQDSNLQ